MGLHAETIADFYQQLALLIKSNLPLPASLRELARQPLDAGFQQALVKLAERTDKGVPLSEALKACPEYFAPHQIQLLAAAERTGALAAGLFDVARHAQLQAGLTTRIRGILVYPLFTLCVAFAVALAVAAWVVPVYVEIFEELLGSAHLPWLTRSVLHTGRFLNGVRPLAIAVFGVLAAGGIWLCSPSQSAHRVCLALLSRLWGSAGLLRTLGCARLCSVWASYIEQGLPFPDALLASAAMEAEPAVAGELRRAATAVSSGQRPAEALAGLRRVDGLVSVALKYAPEAELAGELRRLATLFELRAERMTQGVTTAWTVGTLLVMTAVAGTVVVAMFMPMVQMMESFGGC